jgi:hypothetical protein
LLESGVARMGTIGEEYESGVVLGTHGGKDTHVPRHVEVVTGPVAPAAGRGELMPLMKLIYGLFVHPTCPSERSVRSKRWDLKLSALRYEKLRS